MAARTGFVGEKLAREYLESLGYAYMDSNVVFKGGELDLVMRDGDTIVFCEVKTRTAASDGSAALAVTPAKQKRICDCAVKYIARHGLFGMNVRFDVITVGFDFEKTDINHIKSAFLFVSRRYFV